MKFSYISAIIVIFLGLLLLFSSAFIVSEMEQAIVTKFGRPVRVIAGESNFMDKEELEAEVEEYNQNSKTNVRLDFGAGLYFKTPFINQVEFFDDRILEYDSDAASITTRDKKRLVVDNFARWRISDPLRFKQRVQSEALAQAQLDDIIYSILRSQLGEYDFIEIIRSTDTMLKDTESQIPDQKRIPIRYGRREIMQKVRQLCREAANEYGILIIDVRIKRAVPPQENLEAIYQNMTAERDRIAQKYREEGKREATIIRAKTDREVKTMIAEAERKARVIKGDADAEAAQIYAQGFIKDVTGAENEKINGFQSEPDFYKFLRSLDSLEIALDEPTRLILSTENDLLKYLDEQIPQVKE